MPIGRNLTTENFVAHDFTCDGQKYQVFTNTPCRLASTLFLVHRLNAFLSCSFIQKYSDSQRQNFGMMTATNRPSGARIAGILSNNFFNDSGLIQFNPPKFEKTRSNFFSNSESSKLSRSRYCELILCCMEYCCTFSWVTFSISSDTSVATILNPFSLNNTASSPVPQLSSRISSPFS